MKRILLLGLVLNVICFQVEGQIVVDNTIFPEAGDTLFTAFASNPEIAEVGDIGGDKFWNFSALDGSVYNAAFYLDASEGSSPELFPDADLVIKILDVQDVYIDVQDNKIIELGRSGSDPLGFGLDASLRYSEMPVIQRAPLVYGSSFATDLEVNFSIAIADLPDSLGFEIPLVDSIRITIVSDIEGEIDAWGTMSIPEGEFEVLRLNNITVTNTVLSVFSPLLGWIIIDPTTLPLGEFGELFESRTINNHVFISNTSKEAIADVTLDDLGLPVSVQFKGREIISGSVDSEIYHFKSYPNPTDGLFSIEFGDLPAGDYSFEILDLSGSLLDKTTINSRSQNRYEVDLSLWSQNALIFVARNNDGLIVYSERVLLIR